MSPLLRPAAITAAAPVLLVLLLALAGCSASDSDGGKASGSASGSGGTSNADDVSFDWDLAFAKCMRDQGIDYADPKSGGGVTQTNVDDEAAFDAARKTCTDGVTKERGERPVSADERKRLDKYNDAYTDTVDCLRKKGHDIEVYDGGYSVNDQVSKADIDECGAGDGSQRKEIQK